MQEAWKKKNLPGIKLILNNVAEKESLLRVKVFIPPWEKKNNTHAAS